MNTDKKLFSMSALVLSIGLVGCGSTFQPAPVGQGTSIAKANVAPTLQPWLLHLPGIGGKRTIDVAMTHGFQQGGFAGQVEIYDWTEHDEGLHALIAYDRNHKEAKLIADKITERYDKDPTAPIYISSHSGGGGVAIWALEYLPDRVKITSLLMMSPALSPQYDLTKALRHVTGNVYVFSSTLDELVLYTGCKLMGTIDGVKTAAAGYGGFVRPLSGDVAQYAKLVPMPYNPDWAKYDDAGNHVGGMTTRFAKSVLAPLVLSGKMPPGYNSASAGGTNQAVQ